MTPVSFLPVDQSPLYIPSDTTVDAARVGFLLPAECSYYPTVISLATSLQEYPTGVYLFFTALPYSRAEKEILAQFIEALYTYLTRIMLPGTRFVWLENPADFASGLIGTPLQVSMQGSNVITTRSTAITLTPNINLRISGGCQIAVNSDGTTLVYTSSATAPLALVVTPQGGQPQVVLPIQRNALEIGMLGSSVAEGCFALDLALDRAGLSALDVNLRYFTPYLNPDMPGYVQSFCYPLLNPASGNTIALSAVLDPLASLDPARTYFSFDSGQEIPSYFSSVLGSQVIMSPQASAQLVFAVKLTGLPTASAAESTIAPEPYYLTPVGDFNLTIVGETVAPPNSPPNVLNCLACGFSGIEYLPLLEGKGIITFRAGQNAYSPAQVQSGTSSSLQPSVVYKGLTDAATTSWAYIRSAEAAVDYYAQPEGAVLHQSDAPHSAVPADFLTYLPVLAGTLLQCASLTQVFPIVPYQGVSTDPLITTLEPYEQFENQVLNPERRNLIYKFHPNFSKSQQNVLDTQGSAQGTTPQGLLLTLEGTQWADLQLAQTLDSSNNVTSLLLSDISGPLQAALQSNQLFMVISSPAKFLASCAIPNYKMTVQSKTDLEQSQDPVVPATIIDAVWNAKTLKNVPYTSLTAFQNALKLVLGANYEKYVAVMVRVAALFTVYIQEWRFDLSPYFWNSFNTILIFKFTNSELLNLVQDSSSWVQAAALNDDVNSTQQQLQAIVAAALADNSSEMNYFKTTVLGDKNWNGILALRCRVPLSALPDQIEGIAAGINVNQFFAHHLGITVTPVTVTDGKVTPNSSSLFGLIRYDDAAPLNDQNTDYNFKVLSLKVLFENSGISRFSSQIALLVNKLFLEDVTMKNGPADNNIKLNGVYQKHGHQGSYTFTAMDESLYQVSSQVLDSVEITRAQFITVIPPEGLQTGANVQTRFLFWGNLQFKALPGFDLFSFGGTEMTPGGLSYANLAVDMQFPPDQPYHKTFNFDALQITFDPSTSTAHPDSLYNHFPLKLSGFIQAGQEVTPANLGYMPVDSPLNGSQLNPPWFALVYDLNLGSFGALAGQAGLVANLLTGWAPNTQNYTISIGLRIPGVSGGKREISIEGVIKLTFGDVRFVVLAPSYILQIRNIALHLLSLSFPPGQTDIVLFGDPQSQDNTTLGWYAAYRKANQGNSQSSKQITTGKRDRKRQKIGEPQSRNGANE